MRVERPVACLDAAVMAVAVQHPALLAVDEVGDHHLVQNLVVHGRVLDRGQTFHAAGPSVGGWTIVAVHESQESWERFRDGILMPRMQQGISGGFTTPPQETVFEVHNLQP